MWGVNGLLRRITHDYYDDFNSTTETEYPIAGYRGDILSNFEDYRCFYDAYGNERRDKVSDNPFGYCGEYTDAETGFVYLRGRYYNPSVGRFISEDTHWNVDNMIYGDNQKIENVIAVKEEFATILYDENKVSVELNDENTLTINENLLGMINLSLRENSALTDELNATYNAYSAFEVIKKPDFEAIMQSTNLYMYCIGNPMNFMDPSGWSTTSKVLSTISAGLTIIGGALTLFVPDPAATKVGGYLAITGAVTEIVAIWTD